VQYADQPEGHAHRAALLPRTASVSTSDIIGRIGGH
jgi:hypothetical protein